MTSEATTALAPIGRRACAWLIDAALGLALAFGLVEIAGGTSDVMAIWHLLAFKSAGGKTGHAISAATNPAAPDLGALKPILGLLALVTVITVGSVAYRVVTTAKWGAGIGKFLLGLKVVVEHPTGDPDAAPGWARSWRRWAVPLAPGLIPLPATGLLAYVPAVRDERRRGLHDRAAGTIVVDVRAPAPAPIRNSPGGVLADTDYFVVTETTN
jgi:uncharacterized RDD family membrane protein YckC